MLAALRQIDLCAAVDAARKAAQALSADAEVSTESPFDCRVNVPSAGDITVTIGGRTDVELEEPTVRVLGDAKAYVDGRDVFCTVYLPASFELALMFHQFDPPGQTSSKCTTAFAEDLAANVATILASPDTVAAVPIWDSCSALKAAIRPEIDKYDIDDNTYPALSRCTDPSRSIELSISDAYAPPVPDNATVDTIAGTPVHTYTREGMCYTRWQQGPTNARFAHDSEYGAYFATKDCARSRTLAEAVINVLKRPPPTDVPPQRPLLYAPDEPDGPDPKACKSVPPSVAPPSGALQC